MLSKQIQFVLKYFDACGFNSGQSKLSNSQRAVYITNTTHILMAIFFSLFKIRMIVMLFSAHRFAFAINFILQYSAALYTYWCIILDSNLQDREHRQFWKFVQLIDQLYNPQNDFSFTCCILKFFFCFFISAVAILMALVIGNSSDIEVVFMYIFLIKISEARIFYCILCVEILRFKLNTIDNALTDLRQFKSIREYYYCVYEIASLLNDVFGVSQVAAILFCFYFFLADVNWLYIHFTNQSTMLIIGTWILIFFFFIFKQDLSQRDFFLNTLASFIWLIHPMMLIYFLSESVTRCSLMVHFKDVCFWRKKKYYETYFFNIRFRKRV